jgi:hypothetical protein
MLAMKLNVSSAVTGKKLACHFVEPWFENRKTTKSFIPVAPI